jgi:septal ring factor EnvC (AmiA/AmiB activator)
MNFERTMEFILQQQVKFEESFLRSNRRMDRMEHDLAETQRVLKQTSRVVAKLASTGVSLRSDIRRHEKAIAKHEEMMSEMENKLNALIDIVDKSIRRNGGTKR